MKFDELDAKMRVFETAHDHCVLPGLYIVARLDGRSFTRLTKITHKFNAPFDEKFREYMIMTTGALMEGSFDIVYGYTESDEISLLFDKDESSFSRKLRKLNSILAGHASAVFSHMLADIAVFDCRISQLPTVDNVVDYFRWRSEDAHRNALNSHCHYALLRAGYSPKQATSLLKGMGVPEKNALLFSHGINFNDLPAWQKRGVGLYWEDYEKEGLNPLTQETVKATRTRLIQNMDLPSKDAYSDFIRKLICR